MKLGYFMKTMPSLPYKIWILVIASIFFFNISPASKMAILTPQITYTSRSLDWLTFFLQEQIEIALKQQNIAVMPSPVFRYWETKSSNLQRLFQPTQTSSILKIQFQTVLNQVSISYKLLEKDQPTAHLAENEFQWSTPDELLMQSFQILDKLQIQKFDSKQAKISKFADWNALENLYRWKQQAPSGDWEQESKELETIIALEKSVISATSAELTSVQLLQYWQTRDPHRLEALQIQIQQGLQDHQFTSHYYTLSAQLNYILGRTKQSKTDAIVARAKDQQNLIANAMYGLNIGIQHYEGRRFIRSAVEQFPPLIQPEYFQHHKLPQYEVLSNLIKQAWSDVFNLEDYLNTVYQAKQAIKQQQWYQASQLFQKALQLIPNEIEPLIGITQALIGAKQYSNALLHLESIEQQLLDHPTLLIYKALVYEKLGNLDQAKNLYQQILVMDPKNFQALLRLSALLAITKNYQEAEAFLKTLSVIYPQSTKAWKELGRIYWIQGNQAEAKKAWQQGLLLKPHDSTLKSYLQKIKNN